MRHLLLLLGAGLFAAPTRAADPLSFQDGDRVVLLGATLVEREQRTGYWETLLTLRHPNKNVTFRNLGWSGDTVWGDARAGFGTRADGFKHLNDHVHALRPHVVLIAYGTNESFAGKDGLPAFEAGLKALLDALEAPRIRMRTLGPTCGAAVYVIDHLDDPKPRFVLLAPLKHEKLGPPLPDPAAANANLALYRDAIKQTAEKRGCGFIDLYALLDRDAGFTCASPLTDNGMHLTDFGYWRALSALESGLPKKARTLGGSFITADGKTSATHDTATARLPAPLAPGNEAKETALPGEWIKFTVAGLVKGKYTLSIDGKGVTTATAEEWAEGVAVVGGPDFEQAEKLRQAIVEKNRLYFHRWRPQNETYLFGFRKHEQGQNAREIPEFDPLIEKMEQEIARLRVPASHKYDLQQEKK